MKEKKKLSLAAKTFIGFGLGIVLGVIFGEKASIVKPLGTIFLNMIKMIVVPMVFFSITAGVAALSDIKKLRNIGVKVVGLYAITSAISVCIGLIMANVTNPGLGFDMSALASDSVYEAKEMPSVLDTIINAFPSNVFVSFTQGDMLPIIVFAIFVGVALIMMGEKGQKMAEGVQNLADVMYQITAIVMEFSPIGVCALLADSVGSYGLKVFGPLGKLILTVYASDVILVFLMYVPMVALLARFPVGKWFKSIMKVWVVTASTTSSSMAQRLWNSRSFSTSTRMLSSTAPSTTIRCTSMVPIRFPMMPTAAKIRLWTTEAWNLESTVPGKMGEMKQVVWMPAR